MAYRYTGYAVSGIDVFIWILLTAGSISFPIIILAICCIKLHIRNNKKTKHLSHLLDGDVFDRKAKAAGFNRYFFNQHTLNEQSACSDSASGSPTHKKTVSGGGVLNQLKNTYTYSATTSTAHQSLPPIIINREVVNRDIYSISDSYVNTGVVAEADDEEPQQQQQQQQPPSIQASDIMYARVSTGFDNPAAAAVAPTTSGGDNFETLYSQVTKKPSTRNSSVRNDQALYMNTFYSS